MKSFLDIKRLRYFCAIIEQKSLSGAARQLNIAQPALSHHLSEMENRIGVPLLLRRHDGIVPTDAGRLLFRHAIDIIGRVDRAEVELATLSAGATPLRLRLAVISTLAADLTPILLEMMARQMPEVALRITESPTLDSRELLERGEADMAISLSPAEDSEAPLAEERLYLAMAGDDAKEGAPIPFAEALRHRLIMPAVGAPMRSLVEAAALQAGLTLAVVLEIDGAEPRRNAIQARLGATIFGAHSVRGTSRRKGLIVRPISDPALSRPIYFAVRRGLDPAIAGRFREITADALVGLGDMQVRHLLAGPAA